jgi:hypothetical protein
MAAQAGRVVLIGAAGEMLSIAASRLAAARPELMLELLDVDVTRARALAAGLPRARAGELDLFDRVALGEAIAGARLVVLGAGPYVRTSAPVIDACLAAGVDYLDFADDNEPTTAALARDDDATRAGVAALICCGASPGLTNLMAVDVAGDLDEVETIDLAWCTGDEGPRPYGKAVIEHLLHIAAGDCRTWRDGAPTVVESYATSEKFDMGGGLGPVSLYECAHPEAVTLPRRFPRVRQVRLFGGLDPIPVNGIARGVALAVRDQRLPTEAAVRFFQDISSDRVGSPRGWRHAAAGLRGQLRRGEIGGAELRRFVWHALRGHHDPYRGGLYAQATGLRGGQRVTVRSRTELAGPDTFTWQSMGTATGTAIAAFITLALAAPPGSRVGVRTPEEWVAPADLYAALREIGVPEAELPTKSSSTTTT